MRAGKSSKRAIKVRSILSFQRHTQRPLALNGPLSAAASLSVSAGSPAAKAGLQAFRRGSRGEVLAGDVITAINGEAVNDLDDMLSLLEKRQPGESVSLSVWRDGQTRKQAVVLAAPD